MLFSIQYKERSKGSGGRERDREGGNRGGKMEEREKRETRQGNREGKKGGGMKGKRE